jgi:hypothetical protein
LISADVNINRELYVGDETVREELSLSGVNYKNDIYISDDSASEDASFESYRDEASIRNNIIDSKGFGTTLDLEGQELEGSRMLSIGSSSALALNYGFFNGQSVTRSFNGQSYGTEKLDLKNAYYRNTIIATPTSFYHSGAGIGLLDDNYPVNSISHDVALGYKGKYSKINLLLDCEKDEGVRRAAYSWGAGVGSDLESLGFSNIAVGTSAGNAQMDVHIKGESSELTPKDVSRHIYPLALDETITSEGNGLFDDDDFDQMVDLLLRAGVSQNIYMSYTLE